jgi:hypothetical protein
MNCRKRGPAMKSKQVDKDPSKAGNGVQKKGDTHAMEWKPAPKPEVQKSAKIVDWK